MSTSLPVVWCADRNSVDNKPTAFALQGIHLQGNISEQHVLAVRELINAASEGRLLLPADGGVVVLSCGAGVGSLIVSSNETQLDELNKANGMSDDEKIKCPDRHTTKRINFNRAPSSNEPVLYEFLCCARCMTEGTKCNNKTISQNSKIIERYLDAKINAGKAMRRTSANQNRPLKHRRRANVKNSFKNDKRCIKRFQSNSCVPLPIYATINRREKFKNRESKAAKESVNLNDAIETVVATAAAVEVVQFSSAIHESFRKTSFDSTCTISSMDSGFIEMQNKIELARGFKVQKTLSENIQIKIDPPAKYTINEINDIDEQSDSISHVSALSVKVTASAASTWNRLTIPQQSRNRRKSYEEFKSLFCDQKTATLNVHDSKSLSKSRRKSYEEFKSATNNIDGNATCNNIDKLTKCDDTNSIGNESVINGKANDNLSSFFSRMRRGSKRYSQKNSSKGSPLMNIKKSNQEQHGDIPEFTIYDILRKNDVTSNLNLKNAVNTIENNGKSNQKTKRNYDKNLELFESHCNEHYSKNNLKSCGTIYDIIQKRSDMYSKGYMTYGTLYEILHRKSDEGDSFDRKRTFSEKYSNKQRNNYDCKKSSEATMENQKSSSGLLKKFNSTSVTDFIEENLNSSSTITSASSLKQGSCSTNNQLSITSVNGKQLSTIYDILQTKKLETNTSTQPNKNRFLVRKITEEELIEFQKETDSTCGSNNSNINANNKINTNCSNVNNNNNFISANDTTNGDESFTNDQKKQTKLRRFSNILSYSPKILNEFDVKALEVIPTVYETKTDFTIDEIYSRLNRTNTQMVFTSALNADHLQPQQKNVKPQILSHHQRTIKNNHHHNNTNGSIYKSNSLDMLATTEENQEFFIKQKPHRKISVPAHLPPKILPKKNTRRLSEFTRGEFLNEKS